MEKRLEIPIKRNNLLQNIQETHQCEKYATTNNVILLKKPHQTVMESVFQLQ